MRSLIDNNEFAWGDWCDEVAFMLPLPLMPRCFVHDPSEIVRLAWAAAFRVPSDDEYAGGFVDDYDDALIDLVCNTFPFTSNYSCSWFIDRVYRYMGRTVLGVAQGRRDDSCFMYRARTLPLDLEILVCHRVMLSDVSKTETFVAWLRACMLKDTSPSPLDVSVRVNSHFDEQMQCAYDDGSQLACATLAKRMGLRALRVRYTPSVCDGYPVYLIHACERR